MSTQSTSEDELQERIRMFLKRNFPQIRMHGGSAVIRGVDPEAGTVSIQLGGACSGCGISPMTIQTLKSRLTDEIPEINTVHADTGGDTSTSGGMQPSSAGDAGGQDADDDPTPF